MLKKAVKINRNWVLAFLTCLLVTIVLPAIAQDSISPHPSSILTTQSPSSVPFLEQGKQLYQAGRFAEAAQVWEQAAKAFEQTGAVQNQATSYNYLAIVYQDLGQWDKAKNAIATAFTLLQNTNNSFLYAQVLNTQGSLQLATGNPATALETWKQAEQRYRALKDTTGIVLSQINQAQAMQTLGLYQRARTKLEQLNRELAALPDSVLKVSGLRSLGTTLQVVGDLQQSQAVLGESLAIAQRLNSTAEIGETLFSLGNTARAKGDFTAALQFYQQAKDTAINPLTQLEAQLNQFSLLVNTQNLATAAAFSSSSLTPPAFPFVFHLTTSVSNK